MKLRSAPALDGARWMWSGVRLFLRFPLQWLSCAALVAFGLGLLLTLPWVGTPLAFVLLPALTVGWITCAAAPLHGLRPSPVLLLAPLGARRRGPLLRVGVLYAVSALLMLWLADVVDPDFRSHWARLVTGDGENLPATETIAQVQQGAMLRGLFVVPVALLFWHAPVVAERQHTGVAQAVFTSAVATVRNVGAFVVYGGCWMLADGVVSTVATGLMGLFNAGGLALLVTMPLALAFMAAFYASLMASVAGCISFEDPGAQPAAAPSTPPDGPST